MQDSWTVVAKFCDIKERGRIYMTIKEIHTHWEDLVLQYFKKDIPFEAFKGCIMGDYYYLRQFCQLKGLLTRYRTLRLPSDKAVLCWSPWCRPADMCVKAPHVRVFFNVSVKEHVDFIHWIIKLCQNRERFYPRSMVATMPKRPQYVTRLANGNYKSQQLQKDPFRVKIYLYDHGCGYPTMRIRCIEFCPRASSNALNSL